MELNLTTVKKVFIVGIGGIGISAIARMMLLEGKSVSGSDMAETEITRELAALGASVVIGQSYDLIPKDVDLIVYTIAIKHYDPALMEQIFASGVPAKSYPEMLHIVTGGKYTIAVAGTHGKTTVTAMIAKILIDAEKDPSVIVGSLLKDFQSNLIVGKSEYFVVEACEYERSFLNINPKLLVITNLEVDHLDYYKDLADIQNAFKELVGQTGTAVFCDPHDPNIAAVLEGTKLQVIDYTEYMGTVPPLAVPGEHNRKNAAAALAIAAYVGVPESAATKAIGQFQGTWRRLEKRGKSALGALIYDDYAHHPTEVKASLQALRELYPRGEKRITVIFQPHLYSRTKALFEEFTTCFDESDNVMLLPIYFAREAPDPEVSSEKLADAIRMHRGEAVAFKDFEEAKVLVEKMQLNEKDILVTMGAGEAYKVGDYILNLK